MKFFDKLKKSFEKKKPTEVKREAPNLKKAKKIWQQNVVNLM